jgi:hypothetical protein
MPCANIPLHSSLSVINVGSEKQKVMFWGSTVPLASVTFTVAAPTCGGMACRQTIDYAQREGGSHEAEGAREVMCISEYVQTTSMAHSADVAFWSSCTAVVLDSTKPVQPITPLAVWLPITRLVIYTHARTHTRREWLLRLVSKPSGGAMACPCSPHLCQRRRTEKGEGDGESVLHTRGVGGGLGKTPVPHLGSGACAELFNRAVVDCIG